MGCAGQPPLGPRQRVYSQRQSRARALGERAMALLETRWRALHRISRCPHRIGHIVQATLVLTHHEHHGRYRENLNVAFQGRRVRPPGCGRSRGGGAGPRG
ncbi:transposase family protein [Amycolatopsis sp. CA-128772]|uniref:transposase family protein n=1 Tax=Amycolatopsis sp. CA-128772 TaxID=2073159 RepID=UPI00351A34B0